jgi:hypothetical protein
MFDEDSETLFFLLEKGEKLYLSKFLTKGVYERIGKSFLVLPDLDKEAVLCGILGIGNFGIFVDLTKKQIFYVSFLTGDTIGKNEYPLNYITWQDRQRPTMICKYFKGELKRETFPGMPYFCNTFSHEIAPKAA